jgi:hypothetical protein
MNRGNFYDNFPRFVEKNAWFSHIFTMIFVAKFFLRLYDTRKQALACDYRSFIF